METNEMINLATESTKLANYFLLISLVLLTTYFSAKFGSNVISFSDSLKRVSVGTMIIMIPFFAIMFFLASWLSFIIFIIFILFVIATCCNDKIFSILT